MWVICIQVVLFSNKKNNNIFFQNHSQEDSKGSDAQSSFFTGSWGKKKANAMSKVREEVGRTLSSHSSSVCVWSFCFTPANQSWRRAWPPRVFFSCCRCCWSQVDDFTLDWGCKTKRANQLLASLRASALTGKCTAVLIFLLWVIVGAIRWVIFSYFCHWCWLSGQLWWKSWHNYPCKAI